MSAFEWIIVGLLLALIASGLVLAKYEKQTSRLTEQLIQSNNLVVIAVDKFLNSGPPKLEQSEAQAAADAGLKFDQLMEAQTADWEPVSTVETPVPFVPDPRIQVVEDSAPAGSDEPIYPFVYKRDAQIVHTVDCWYAQQILPGERQHPWAWTVQELDDWLDFDENVEMRACLRCEPLKPEGDVS